MSMLVLTLTGFAAAMGIPVLLTVAAESAASTFKGALPLRERARASAKRRYFG